MQAAIVMLFALSGIGCQNPTESTPPNGAQSTVMPTPNGVRSTVTTPPNRAQADVPPPPSIPDTPPLAESRRIPGPTEDDAANFELPPPYPVYSGGPFSALDVEDDSFGTCVRKTFWSFIIGRDPDVPSACEIESAYRAGLYNH